jgi:putative methyltransferase (TIGR04325 family)
VLTLLRLVYRAREYNMFSTLAPKLMVEAGRVPLIGSILQRFEWRRFCAASGHVRLFHGVYRDFASAAAAVPQGRAVGCDNEVSVQRLADERFRVLPLDYPVLFWLQRLLPGCRVLFDFGGHVGISYFAFRHHLRYAPELTWLVCDLPAVAAAGSRIARQEQASHLHFTTGTDALRHAGIFMALGSLHFVESPFQMFKAAAHLPEHVLLNKVPVGNGRSAVTLHNMGCAFCPYHLFNREEFEGTFRRLGYDLIDRWANPGLGAHIPLHRLESIAAYSGYYFHRKP